MLTLGKTGLVANPEKRERSKAPPKTIKKKKDPKVKKSSNSKSKVQFAPEAEEIEPWVPPENTVNVTGKPAPKVKEGEEPCLLLRSCAFYNTSDFPRLELVVSQIDGNWRKQLQTMKLKTVMEYDVTTLVKFA